MATSLFSRPNQARRTRRHIADQHPSNATLVPDPDPDEPDDDDDFRSISIAPSNASGHGHLRSPHPGSYPIFDDLLPSDVRELGPPSARGYHNTSQFREKSLHAPSPSKPQKKPSLGLKGLIRRTFSRKHASAPPTTKRVPSLAPAPSIRRSFRSPNLHNPNQLQVSNYPIHSAPPSPTPTVQATEVMDVNIPDEHTHHEDYNYTTATQQHTSSALGRRATAPPPRRRRSSRSSQSIRSFASSEPASLFNQHHTLRVHPAGSIDPNHQYPHPHPHPHAHTGARTRVFVPPAATATAARVPQRKRIFTGPWYNRRGDMWIGVGPGPGEFRALNTNEMTFHPNFQNYPSEHGQFMNADGDVMDAIQLRMIRRADMTDS
jgi:hypothetical protein